MMESRLTLLLILILTLLVNASAISESKLPKIEIDPLSHPLGKMMLSDLVKSIEYIPLETKRNCLIGKIDFFDVSKDYIVIYCSKSVAVLLFRRDGRFIRQLGRKGQGRGEYLQYSVSGVFISEDQKQIIIKSDYPNQLLIYDLNGRLVRVQKSDGMGGILRLFQNKFLVTYPNSRGEKPYTYEIRTRELKLLAQHVKTVSYDLEGAPNSTGMTWLCPACCYQYNGQLHVKEVSLNDTLYSIGKDNSFNPTYLISVGKYAITVDLRRDFNSFLKRMPEYVRLETVFETKENSLLSYEYNNKRNYCYFDKQSRKLLYFKSDKGIPNNYDGGVDFWPQKQNNDEWIAFYDTYVFKESNLLQRRFNPVGPKESIKYMNTIRKNLDSEDNPVMIIVNVRCIR